MQVGPLVTHLSHHSLCLSPTSISHQGLCTCSPSASPLRVASYLLSLMAQLFLRAAFAPTPDQFSHPRAWHGASSF